MTARLNRSAPSPLRAVLTLSMPLWCLGSVHAQGTSDVPDGLSTSDWSSIRAAYEAGRHRAFPVDGGYRARNPGQRLSTRFDGRGFTVEPDGGGWSWGLELARYGFAGSERVVRHPVRTSADGQRVEYDWDAGLTEWYINDARGLEHGYTLRERPVQTEAGPLMVALAVRGGLEPRVHSDGRGVCFANGDGASVLTYAGLIVRDAEGQEIRARIERAGVGLRICVDESAARYPLTIDPVVQQAYLKASNTEATVTFSFNDEFGTPLRTPHLLPRRDVERVERCALGHRVEPPPIRAEAEEVDRRVELPAVQLAIALPCAVELGERLRCRIEPP